MCRLQLLLRPRRHHSPQYSTQGFDQAFGYFEARVKASPGGRNNLGMCPAFWLPNVRNGGDDCVGEIDLVEIPGGLPFGNGTQRGVECTMENISSLTARTNTS